MYIYMAMTLTLTTVYIHIAITLTLTTVCVPSSVVSCDGTCVQTAGLNTVRLRVRLGSGSVGQRRHEQ